MARSQHEKHLSAGKIIRKNIGKVIGKTLVQLLLRVIALIPLYFALKGVSIPGVEQSAILLCALSGILYLLMVMPLRYLATGFVWVEKGYEKPAYGTMLAASLRRVSVGLVWGLPFIASAGLWFYAFNGMEMPTFFSILTTLGGIVGGRFDAGIVLWVGGIAVFALLFAFGWWYNMPKDYAYLGDGVKAAFRKAGRMRAKNGAKYVGNAIVNMVLTVPSLVIMAAVMGVHYVGSVNLSMGAMAAAQQLMSQLTRPLPAQTMAYLAVALVVVHVPLCVYRKTRNAVLTYKLLAESEKAE